jgi:hypothetical protein
VPHRRSTRTGSMGERFHQSELKALGVEDFSRAFNFKRYRLNTSAALSRAKSCLGLLRSLWRRDSKPEHRVPGALVHSIERP